MASTTKELVAFHLDHTYEKEAGYPPLARAVAGLTADQAAWKPSPARHSIWQIVRHLVHWKQAFLAALDGHPVEYDAWNREDWQEIADTQQEWERDLARLHAVSREMRRRLDAFDDEGLSRSITWFAQSASPHSILTRFLEMATHDTYHAGQIQYLVALQEIPVEELAAAASRNDLPRMEHVLAADPQALSAFSRDGWTPLHVACYFGMVEAVALLLSRGAPPNAVSRNTRAHTPLHLAVGGIANQAEIVRLLVNAGADASRENAAGKTPRDLAKAGGNAAVVAVLES